MVEMMVCDFQFEVTKDTTPSALPFFEQPVLKEASYVVRTLSSLQSGPMGKKSAYQCREGKNLFLLSFKVPSWGSVKETG